MCAGGVIQSIGNSQNIRFIFGLSVCMPFTPSCLMVSNFSLCGMPILSGFCSRDFILEMSSMRYINMFGFLFFISTGLTVCYSFRLFYFVICSDFNFISSHWMVDIDYSMVFGMVGLLVISVDKENFPINTLN